MNNKAVGLWNSILGALSLKHPSVKNLQEREHIASEIREMLANERKQAKFDAAVRLARQARLIDPSHNTVLDSAGKENL